MGVCSFEVLSGCPGLHTLPPAELGAWWIPAVPCTSPVLLCVPSVGGAWRPNLACVHPASPVPVLCSPSHFAHDFLTCTLTGHSVRSSVYVHVFLPRHCLLAHCLHVHGSLHSTGRKERFVE